MNMDTQEYTESVVSTQANHSGLSVVIHPLALLNITDHFTRIQVQASSQHEQLKVIGVLLGTQTGRKISICNSFEVKVSLLPQEGQAEEIPGVLIDEAYLVSKQDHIKQVFPNLDAIGWYSVGAVPTILELELQEKYFQSRIDSPLFLQFNARALLKQGSAEKPSLRNRTDLPLVIYEPFYDAKRTLFIEAPDYAVETESIQRMALAAMAQAEGASTAGSVPMEESDNGVSQTYQDSPILQHLSRQRATVCILMSRIKTLILYLQDVANGLLPHDHNIMREINSLICQLPNKKGKASQTPNVDTSNLLYSEFNDILLGNYLSSLTECSSHLIDLVATFDAIKLNAQRNKAFPIEGASNSRTKSDRRMRR